jgi:hypothetical protein
MVNSTKLNSETDKPQRKPASMHENVPVWYDCCSCEAEPYWIEAFAQADENIPAGREKPAKP